MRLCVNWFKGKKIVVDTIEHVYTSIEPITLSTRHYWSMFLFSQSWELVKYILIYYIAPQLLKTPVVRLLAQPAFTTGDRHYFRHTLTHRHRKRNCSQSSLAIFGLLAAHFRNGVQSLSRSTVPYQAITLHWSDSMVSLSPFYC